MSKYITVSAKIPKELKEKMREMNINISQLVRRAIEEEVNRREENKLRILAAEASRSLKKIPPEEITRIIRETREQR